MTTSRRQAALQVRQNAAQLAHDRVHPVHVANGDEQKFSLKRTNPCTGKVEVKSSYLASFTKGMPHNLDTGLVEDPSVFEQFVKAIDSGDPRDFKDTPLGPSDPKNQWLSKKAKGAELRAWESQSAGNAFDLEGPDAQAVTMPPAPELGSDELIAEMAEVYLHALLRDEEFTDLQKPTHKVTLAPGKTMTMKQIANLLNKLAWFQTGEEFHPRGDGFVVGNLFRGVTPGDDVGPYISQFLLAGNSGLIPGDVEPIPGEPNRSPKNGLIAYGSINIDQRVRMAKEKLDYMTTWDEWLDVQHGANLAGREDYESKTPRRFITSPRDLATYVHYDALYEAYLNACLIMIGQRVPLDPGLPFQEPDVKDHQFGFALFGGPHILSLVTEVATRALKAVRFQKFNVHRRMRPEVLAARLSVAKEGAHKELQVPELLNMLPTTKTDPNAAFADILDLVAKKNGGSGRFGNNNYLLPMAFCEGSPMHPAYGAGHATVAGACVTILKAFFSHGHPLDLTGSASDAFVPVKEGASLKTTKVVDAYGQPRQLTVEGELNKLASNISIGRDWAGVHYYSDYLESIRMGEQIALGILEEQKLTYGENFSMTVPLYDGGVVRI